MERIIETDRLRLIALSREVHEAMLEKDYACADELVGAKGLSRLPLEARVLELRLKQLVESPKLEQWLLRAIVLRESNEVIGNIGFHSAPDASYLLEEGLEGLEYGYHVLEGERRKGFAQEASCALMEQAFEQHCVTMFVLSIGPENAASNGLAQSMGFIKHMEYDHSDRGVEYIYTLQYMPR